MAAAMTVMVNANSEREVLDGNGEYKLEEIQVSIPDIANSLKVVSPGEQVPEEVKEFLKSLMEALNEKAQEVEEDIEEFENKVNQHRNKYEDHPLYQKLMGDEDNDQ